MFKILSFCRVLASEGAVAWARQEGLPICQHDDLITGRNDVTTSLINSFSTDRARTVYVDHKSRLDEITSQSPTKRARGYDVCSVHFN